MRHFGIGVIVCVAAFAALVLWPRAPETPEKRDDVDHADQRLYANEPEAMEDEESGGIEAFAGPATPPAFGGARGINPTPSAVTGGVPPGMREPSPTEVRTWQRSGLTPNTSRLRVGDEEDLPLRAMQATVRVDGFRARVVLDCVYENDREERLEGNFQLRLPNDATPFYLGFGATKPAQLTLPDANDVFAIREARAEVWTEPKEARMVPREKASRAYGEVVRREIDPAILEWSGAGVFNARVFPLEPRRLHRIVIGYEVDLLPVGADLEYRLDLPAEVPELLVDLTVRGGAHDVSPPTPGSDGRYVWESPAARTFTVRMKKPGAVLLEGRDAQVGDLFAAVARPQLDAAPAASVRRATFLVDISLSSDPDAIHVWLALLEAILERNRPELEEFNVLFFNVEAFWWRTRAANMRDNVRALLDDAKGLALEGATDLGLALRTAAAGPPGDLFLLSDGAATWGESDRHALAKCLEGRTLFAYTTGLAGTETGMLQALARESGGAVFSVVGEAEVATAATAHTAQPWRLLKAEVEGGSDVILAGRPETLFPGQTLFLAGRGRPTGPLVLTVAQHRAARTVRVPLGEALESDLAPGAYGRIAVSQLEEVAAPESRAYALHFGVVGETCSLLMLESEQDYLDYGIEPEDDAQVVREQPAAAAVARVLAEAGASLGDAKRRFLAWLDRLPEAAGVELELPPEIRAAAESLPREAFEIRPDPFACRARGKAPGSLRSYDEAVAVAERRLAAYGPGDALKALSSLVEQQPGDAALARDVGFRAMEWGLGGQAYHLFRRVAEARPYEPQAYHALALCLADLGRPDLALVHYEIARSGEWNTRFGEFPRILDLEYLRFLRAAAEDPRCTLGALARKRLGEVAEETEPRVADLMVVIAWNTDRTDVDLHVIDPNGEECYYDHAETAIGGELTRDVTTGYGPEMFVLERAIPGEYRVDVNFFASDRNRLSARTKVYATVYEDWGRPNERVTRKVVTLAENKERHPIVIVERRVVQ